MAEELKKATISIPFPSTKEARLVYEVLNIDKELKGVHRRISVDKDNLVVNFESHDFKSLRVTVNGFLNNVILVTKTMSLFDS